MSKESTAPAPVDYSSSFFLNALKCEINRTMVNQTVNACPMAVRLAWHSSGTFDAGDSSGGSNAASMRFAPEITDDANAGLPMMQDMLLPVKKAFPTVSHADIWAVAGGCAVEFAGGPKIDVHLGRTDAIDGGACPANGRLPDAAQGAQHLRDVFYRMGFNDQEIVALSGAHTLGRMHKSRSGFDGPWTADPLKFDNTYFTLLMDGEWVEREWDGPVQFTDVASRKYTMLPTDMAVKTDPSFAAVANKYAADAALFFFDFKAAYEKLLSLGCPSACQPESAAEGKGAESANKVAKSDSSAEFREHCMHGSIEHAAACLTAGADASSREANSNRSALHKAAFWGHAHLMPMLLGESKVDPNPVDYAGNTPAHDASRFGHVDIIKALVAAGADPNIKNNDGLTVVDMGKAYDKDVAAAVLA